MELQYQLTKTYWITTVVRMALLHYPIYVLVKKIQPDLLAARAIALVIVIPFVALLGWATRIGADVEMIFGNVYLFYLLTNLPAALIVFMMAMLIFRKEDFENDGKN